MKTEVRIEDCLHIEFEYDKSKYHLADVVVGKVYFLLVRIKIKHMELAVIRREAAGAGPNQHNESETITRYEVMDGAPVRGECVPVLLGRIRRESKFLGKAGVLEVIEDQTKLPSG